MTESFLPHVNGVTNSVLRLLEYLAHEGHDAIVLAPGLAERTPEKYAGFDVVPIPSVPLPGYPQVRLGIAHHLRVAQEFRKFHPDVVHLASPFVLGSAAVRAAEKMNIPSVAVYQTDVSGFASRYGLNLATEAIWARLRRIHASATLTLAPSTAAYEDLAQQRIPHVQIWRRGVDSELFNPKARDESWRAAVASPGELIVGYVGRLAREKNLEFLAALSDRKGIRLVVVGEGPYRKVLERMLPGASFLGFQKGEDLARCMASLDVLVHPGEHETFCQVVQEAMACGTAVVAPASGGPRDLIESGKTGLLYEPGRVEAMTAAVDVLLQGALLREQLSTNARSSVESKSWFSVCSALESYYRQVTEK